MIKAINFLGNPEAPGAIVQPVHHCSGKFVA